MKECRDIGARPHVCGVFLKFLMFVLPPADGLGTSSINWAQLSRLSQWRQNPVSETLRVINKNRTMDNVQKHNNCFSNIPTLSSES
jgi:hypothetical protein